MGHLLNGWRRKTAFVLLMLGMIFLSFWVRAQMTDGPEEWTIPLDQDTKYVVWFGPDRIRLLHHKRTNTAEMSTSKTQRLIDIPHWAVIVPLLAGSVYLILMSTLMPRRAGEQLPRKRL